MRRSAPLLAIVVVASVAVGGVAFAAHDFDDVPTSNPFHDDISWAVDEGITTGYPDGGFHPSEPVTRQAMAAFLHRLSGTVPSVGRVVDANLLRGQTPEQLQPDVRHARNMSDVEVVDIFGPTATIIVTLTNVPAGTHLVYVSGSARATGHEEAVITCHVDPGATNTVLTPANSLERLRMSTEENLSDWAHLSGTAVIDLNATASVRLRCGVQGTSGTGGDIFVQSTSLIALSVQDV